MFRAFRRGALNRLRGSSARPLSVRGFSSNGAVEVDNPYTGETYCTVPYLTDAKAEALVTQSSVAQKAYYQSSTLDERIALCERFCVEIKKLAPVIAKDVSGMMGKPYHQALGEVDGCIDRAEAMIAMAPAQLADVVLPKEGFQRKLAREPVGVVTCIAPWNYPLLTAVNCILPSILAGNSVLLKHSTRTPLVADHFETAFKNAGAPDGLLMALHATHATTADVLARPEVGYAHFTGSVQAGHTVNKSVADTSFMGLGLELGGKDPAYVRADVDVKLVAANVVDGAFYNAGQSCCGIERAYIAREVYDEFVTEAGRLIGEYQLGDPALETTNIGPLAQESGVAFLEKQVNEAVEMGARLVVGGKRTSVDGKGRFYEPTLVADCTHDMNLMMEESFGPVLSVQAVDSDAEAIAKMNDSPYGLTASIWTKDVKVAEELAPQIETGTVFLNRCDFLDPELAWTGVKDTGRGISLSQYGFDAVTRVKSYHFRPVLE